MSNAALTWAWRQRAGGASAKAVLIALADHADDEGACWPSVARLVAHTEVSERTIRTVLGQLIRSGLVRVEHRSGNSSRYLLPISDEAVTPAVVASPPERDPCEVRTPANVAPLQPSQRGGATIAGKGCGDRRGEVRMSHPNPHRTITEPSGNPHQVPAVPAEGQQVRGTRLPTTWDPGDAGREFARSLGLDPDQVLPDFRDYWNAEPGAKARKVDWLATWRGRCRHLAQRRGPGRPAAPSKLAWMTRDLPPPPPAFDLDGQAEAVS